MKSNWWKWLKKYRILEITGLLFAVAVWWNGNNVREQFLKRPRLVYAITVAVTGKPDSPLFTTVVVIRNVGNAPAADVGVKIGPGVKCDSFHCQGLEGYQKQVLAASGYAEGNIKEWPAGKEMRIQFCGRLTPIDVADGVELVYNGREQALDWYSAVARSASPSALAIVVIGLALGLSLAQTVRASVRSRRAEDQAARLRYVAEQAKVHVDQAEDSARKKTKEADKAIRASAVAYRFNTGLQLINEELADVLELMQEQQNEANAHDPELIKTTVAKSYDMALRYLEEELRAPGNRVTGCVLAVKGNDFVARAHLPGLSTRRMRDFRRGIDVGLEGAARSGSRIQCWDALDQDKGLYVENPCLEFRAKSEIVIPIVAADNRCVGVICMYANQSIPMEIIQDVEVACERLGHLIGLAALLDPEWET